MTGKFILPQPNPTAGSDVEIWSLVLRDMQGRKEFGEQKYKMQHLANNGRDPMIDLYQELLDAVAYTRQILYEKYGE